MENFSWLYLKGSGDDKNKGTGESQDCKRTNLKIQYASYQN